MSTMKTKYFLLLLLFPIWVFGQFSDIKSLNKCNVCSPNILKGDLNNDGNLDIIVSSTYGDNKLVWYQNLGNQKFSKLKVVSNQITFSESISLLDLDEDGYLDIISTTRADIAWYKNKGNNIFSSRQMLIEEIEGLKSFYFSDIDGDNKKDLIYSLIFTANKQADNRLAWRKNSGRLNFSNEQIISFTCGTSGVSTTDLNGDGQLDIVATQTLGICDSKLIWYENIGEGNFSEEQIISAAGSGFRSYKIEDIDDDGSLDIACIKGVGRPSKAQLVWYKNDGSGNFSNQKIINSLITNASVLKSSDIDGDMDFVSHSSQENRIAWYENENNGANFKENILNPHSVGFYDFEIADFDSDNQLDLLVSSLSNNKLMLFENNSQNFLLNTIEEGTQAEGTDILATDMDNDSDLDIVYASAKDGRIVWNENDGLGNFEKSHLVTTSANGAYSIQSADLDNNGTIDIVSASLHENKIAWYSNDEKGNFSDEIIISTEVRCLWDIYTADLDGDRDLDLLSASSCDDKIAWYENNGKGQFSMQKIISLDENSPSQVLAVDLDGDGDLDILSGGFVGDVLLWHENDGTGNFSSANVISSASDTRVESVFASDLDGDGDMDVLSTHPFRDKVAWYKNDGSGVFSEQIVISTEGNNLRDLYVVDLDCDDDLDILSTVYRGSDFFEGLVWYRNEGSEIFSDQLIISDGLFLMEAVYAADLDGDKDIDLLSAAREGVNVAWHENLMDPSKCKKDIFQNIINLIAFPNPTKGVINIELPAINPVSKPILILFDNTGKEVLSYNVTSRFIILPIEHLYNGLYYYKISSEEGDIIAKGKVVKY